MSDEPGTLTKPLKFPLSPKQKKLDFCIICQKLKDSQGCTKLTSTLDGRNKLIETSTLDGRNKLIETSELLGDEFLAHLSNNELSEIKYHVKIATRVIREMESGMH